MERRIRLGAMICGTAVVALILASPALSQEEGCTGPPEGCGGEDEDPA